MRPSEILAADSNYAMVLALLLYCVQYWKRMDRNGPLLSRTRF